MFSDITTEHNVKEMVDAIKKEIDNNKGNKLTIDSLNIIGLKALDMFDYSVPDWADEYFKLFRK